MADLYVGCSPAAAQCLPDGRGRVICNAVDLRRLEPLNKVGAFRQQLGLRDDAGLIGFIGRMSWEKNPYDAVNILAALDRRWHLALAGHGAEIESVLSLAHDLGVAARVHAVGVRADIGDVLRDLDAIVVTSTQEGFGYVIAEAWAVGTPVYSTRVGAASLWPDAVIEIPTVADSGIQRDGFRVRAKARGRGPFGLAAEIIVRTLGTEESQRAIARGRHVVETHLKFSAFGQTWSQALAAITGFRLPPDTVAAGGDDFRQEPASTPINTTDLHPLLPPNALSSTRFGSYRSLPRVVPASQRLVGSRFNHGGLSELRSHWDEVARLTDRLAERAVAHVAAGETFADSGRRALAVLLDVCPASSDKTLLDFGCGLGRVTQHLDPLFGQVYAVDLAPSMVRAVERLNLTNTTVILDDGHGLAPKVPLVDIVYSESVLLHNAKRDVISFWPKVMDRLVKGGRAYFQLPCYDLGKEPRNWTDVGVWTEFEIRALARACNCDVEQIWTNQGVFSSRNVGPVHHRLHVFVRT